MDITNHIKIGSIAKVNRKTGEISVLLEKSVLFSADEEQQLIFIETDGGLVPFFVSMWNAPTDDNIRILLEDYASPGLAQRFIGCGVFLPSEAVSDRGKNQPVNVEALKGFRAVDRTAGDIGVVGGVIDSSMQLLLQVFNGETGILIPFVEEFLDEIDNQNRVIYLNLPEGLLDINQE
jgi:16S rRNA processing protein RimM